MPDNKVMSRFLNQQNRRTLRELVRNEFYYEAVVEPPSVVPIPIGTPYGIQLVSDTMLLIYTYPFTYTGLIDALTAALPNYTVILPPGILVITTFTIPIDVTLRGIMQDATVLSGDFIQLSDGSILSSLTLINSGSSADPIVGVMGPDTSPAKAGIASIKIDVDNSAGPAYAVQLTCGDVDADSAELLAETGTDGYAAFVSFGVFTHYSGRAVGTIAGLPYFLDI